MGQITTRLETKTEPIRRRWKPFKKKWKSEWVLTSADSCCGIVWLRTGFGLVIGFTKLLQLLTTSEVYALIVLHTSQITIGDTRFSSSVTAFTSRCLVAASTADVPFPLGSWIFPGLRCQLLIVTAHHDWTPAVLELTTTAKWSCLWHLGTNRVEKSVPLLQCNYCLAMIVCIPLLHAREPVYRLVA
jgi:hypothetical protein